jgi:FkbM family methyltransferase
MNIIEKQLDNGYKVKAFENSVSIIDEIWVKKIYEKDIIITAGMTVLDVGANQGFFSLYAAGKGAYVYSVEPEQNNFNLLRANISDNKLEPKIKAFKYAVSSSPGFIDLFLLDYDVPFASGIVTTSRNFLENIAYVSKDHKKIIQKQKVECITLNRLFEMTNLDKIDLLKIDCEGAEIDILRSASKEKYKKINHIVMETHDVYSEKEIFYCVKDLGFNIITYNKIGGFANTGYLFAQNNEITKKPVWDTPIALFDLIPYIEKNKKLQIDASKSFSTQNNDLRYKWLVDGEPIKDGNNDTLGAAFESTGPHSVVLEVTDNKNKKTDKMEKKIWVIANDYFNGKNEDEIKLSEAGREYFYTFKGTKYFAVTLPKIYVPDEIVIYFEYTAESNYGAVVEFNGVKMQLDKTGTEIKLTDFPISLEINFRVTAENTEALKVMWWTREKYKEIVIDEKDKKPGLIYLKQKNMDSIHRLKEKNDFIIYHKYLPTDWVPNYLVVQISVIDEENDAFDGYLECSGKNEKLESGYAQIKLAYKDSINDIIFSIITGQQNRKVKISWWLSMN